MLEPTSTPGGWVELTTKSGGFPKANETVVECVREPLVAWMVTLYTFRVVALHDNVAFPYAIVLFGVTGPHVRPFGTISVKTTVPENPFNPITATVAFAEEPTSTGGGGEAVRAKSLNRKTAEAE